MPACQTCGVVMAVSEQTQRRDGVVGNWHRDCAYLDYLCSHNTTDVDETWWSTVACARRKLEDKHAGNSTDFP